MSDSVSTQHAMLVTQLSDRVKRSLVNKGSVIQLIDYMCSEIQNRKIIVVLYLEIITPDSEIIGNPKLYTDMTGQKVLPNGNSMQSAGVGYNDLGAQNHGHSTQSFKPTVQASYQPPPNYRIHGAIMKKEAPARIIPITALNPYKGRWAIKARVTAKGDLLRYNNARGDGKVFSFDRLDSDGGDVRVTFFNLVVD